ncbi:MAG TPA: AAA family ATPase [Streptosporangiaceae bacterium]|nr:AAA family ATPase [Streptosporangiaceae bacterium]
MASLRHEELPLPTMSARRYPGARLLPDTASVPLLASGRDAVSRVLPLVIAPLRGRDRELSVLGTFLDAVRAGGSRVLVVRGEPGVGKTALLDCLAWRASGCRVARAAGVQPEMELAFAGLHQLCAPMLDHAGPLPAPQRRALLTAFGISAGSAPDPFLVGLAVLGLLSEVAGERPLLCVVDDAQWLDRASAQALAFVARRLAAEPVGLVFAAQGGELAGLPELPVAGLPEDDARALLDSVIPGRLDERVRDRIVAETRGNPLALLELPRGLSAAELAGGFGLPGGLPLEGRLERSFLRRLGSLPVTTRRLLLAAAAEPTGEAGLLWRAAGRLGVGVDAAAPAEAAGLIELGARVRFRHPLLRAAAYRAAAAPDRREVHGALAEATDPDADPDRRAWHRACAAAGPDEAVAAELERSAARAHSRGGVAAAAAFLRRSAELTPDTGRRGTRALAAARATFAAGAPRTAHELLAMAELGWLDEFQRAELARLRAQMALAEWRGSDAPRLLLDAAKKLEPLDSGLTRETYLEALGAAIFAGRLDCGLSVREAAEAARTAPPARQPPRPVDLLLDGVATRLTEGYAAGVPPLRRALDALRQDGRGEAGVTGWLWLACPVAPEPIAPELWDDAAWHELTARAVGLAREAGALGVLPVALTYRAGVHVHAGEFSAAAGLIEEAEAITAATGGAPLRHASLMLAAWRGEEARTLELTGASVQDATARGEGRALGLAGYVTAVLYNGLGGYQAALAGARRACEHEDLGFFGWSLAELVEAGARSGAREEASAALRQLGERTSAAGSQWALGIAARSRALLSEGPAADALYREAVDRLGSTRIAVHLARAHLVYGEWLRREQRRAEAREHLRAAHDMFGRFGATAFAERAFRELRATGETVRKRTVDPPDALTGQEAQVARLAAEGHTNTEIGARLFISPRTAEYHLHKVFAKLGISSRRQLRHRLA